jgi:hypothetical protein
VFLLTSANIATRKLLTGAWRAAPLTAQPVRARRVGSQMPLFARPVRNSADPANGGEACHGEECRDGPPPIRIPQAGS